LPRWRACRGISKTTEKSRFGGIFSFLEGALRHARIYAADRFVFTSDKSISIFSQIYFTAGKQEQE
jgi:hypothetical protein